MPESGRQRSPKADQVTVTVTGFAAPIVQPLAAFGRSEGATLFMTLLAAFQVGDLVVTQVSPKDGSAHLDHLGVPIGLRPSLPLVKAAAVVALVAA